MSNKVNLNFDIFDNCILTNTNLFIFCYKIKLKTIYLQNDESILKTQLAYKKLINLLPIDTLVKFYSISEYDNIIIDDVPNNILHNYYKNHFKDRNKLDTFFYLTIQFQYNLKSIKNDYNVIKHIINNTEATSLNNFLYFSGGEIIKIQEEEIRIFIKKYHFGNDINFEREYFNEYSDTNINDKNIITYSCTNYSSLDNEINNLLIIDNTADINHTINDKLLYFLNFPCIQVVSIIIDNQEKRIQKIEKNRKEYEYLNFIPGYTEKENELSTLIADLKKVENEKKIFQFSYSLIVPFDSISQFENINKKIIGILQQFGFKRLIPNNKLLNENIYFNCSPLINSLNNSNSLFFSIWSENIPAFLPTQQHYINDKNGFYFCDRFNNPIKVDIWDEKNNYIQARNFIIVAPTGSGKSFIAQHILLQAYENSYITVIIDIGKSFEKFTKIIGDDALFIEYKENTNFGINPFNIDINKLHSIDYLNYLTHFILAHCFDKNILISEIAFIFIRKTILLYIQSEDNTKLNPINYFQFYCDNEQLFIDNLSTDYNQIKNLNNNTNYNYFKIYFTEYLPNQNYYFLYDESKKLNYNFTDKKLIVFEIEAALNNERIISILLTIINFTIENNILKDPNTKGFIFFDEFAKTLKLGNVLTLTEFLFQSIRKKNGSIGIVLQSLEQLPKNQTANAILDNTQLFYILQTDVGYNNIFDRLVFSNKFSQNIIKSLKSQKSSNAPLKYTEFFLKRGNDEKILRVETSLQHFYSFLTDGDLNSTILRNFANSNNNNLLDFLTLNYFNNQ